MKRGVAAALVGALAATVVQCEPAPARATSLRAYCAANVERLPYTPAVRATLGEPFPLVACCESRQDPHARNGSSRGLLQVHARAHARWLRTHGYTAADLERVDVNLAAARHVRDESVAAGRGPLAPWSPSRPCWGR